MKLHNLRDFLAVAERGSINAAARHLGVSQPSISRSLAALEKELGVPLLERHTKGTLLTPMGEIFARRANASVSELRRAREEILQLNGSLHGTVSACFSSLSHVMLLPQALKQFVSRYPNVILHLIEGGYPAVESRLKSGELDFYVGPAQFGGTPPELQMERLLDNSRVVLARKSHPLAKARSLQDFVEARWITTSITERAEAELGELFASHHLPPPRLALRAESAMTWMTALINTDMLTVTAPQFATAPMLAGHVETLRIRELIAGPSLVIIRRSAVPPTPAAEFFCDMIRRCAAPFSETAEPNQGKGRALAS